MFWLKCRQLCYRVSCLFLLLISTTAPAQQGRIKETYIKIERMIPMRDGVELFTAIYIPKDSDELHPIIMNRTPYSCEPYGEENFTSWFGNPAFMEEKYIVVYQDVRGRHMSGGQFTEVTPNITDKKSNRQVDESSDTYDTVDWLLKNIKGNNGKVGIHGISYPGFYATAALPNAHPAIKAVSPQAPVTDEFEGDDVYHRGAFFLLDNVDFLNFFDSPRSGPVKEYPLISEQLKSGDAYDWYLKLGPIKNINENYFKNQSVIWNEYLTHATKDNYWQARNIRPHLTNITPAVLNVGGWFDAEDMFGTLKTYEAIEKQNPVNNNFLLMGPWTHGGWARGIATGYATYQFGMNTSTRFFEMETAFFNYYLKGKGNANLPEATIYFTGNNEWRSFPKWPAPGTKNYDLYFAAGKKLSHSPVHSRLGLEQYISDPKNPVPYTPLKTGTRDQGYLGEDQRFASARPDVISFETDVLKENVTLAGAIRARLFITSTSTDVDFVVKVIDVLPDSIQQLVRAEVMRGKFRNSFIKPEPFVPGKITPVKLTLNDMAHTFKAGHKIMVQVQSSWFPLIDRNPQTFMNIPNASEMDFQKATIRIERNARYQSVIQCQRL
jgi:putative CocE/NonD family hydrolase